MGMTKPAKKIASREELAKLKKEFHAVTLMREISENPENRTEVVVSMETCGIKAGARDTMLAFVDEVAANGLEQVSVLAASCAGNCDAEPVIEIKMPGRSPVRYKNVDVATAKEIVKEHLVLGNIVERAKM
ncbi:MAG: (2Fe-2S) ferredoxin domain-containing protein [Defluviitaleaceae bacterium]|nr:(2Fe-2S) ferredoxin domain-containing protein [Defluviitaleaceae bacterium]